SARSFGDRRPNAQVPRAVGARDKDDPPLSLTDRELLFRETARLADVGIRAHRLRLSCRILVPRAAPRPDECKHEEKQRRSPHVWIIPLRGKERTFTESLRFENALHIAGYFTG